MTTSVAKYTSMLSGSDEISRSDKISRSDEISGSDDKYCVDIYNAGGVETNLYQLSIDNKLIFLSKISPKEGVNRLANRNDIFIVGVTLIRISGNNMKQRYEVRPC